MFHSVTESPLEMSALIQKEKQRGGASLGVCISHTNAPRGPGREQLCPQSRAQQLLFRFQ